MSIRASFSLLNRIVCVSIIMITNYFKSCKSYWIGILNFFEINVKNWGVKATGMAEELHSGVSQITINISIQKRGKKYQSNGGKL